MSHIALSCLVLSLNLDLCLCPRQEEGKKIEKKKGKKGGGLGGAAEAKKIAPLSFFLVLASLASCVSPLVSSVFALTYFLLVCSCLLVF